MTGPAAARAPSAPEVTALLLAWREGDPRAFDRLVPIVVDELRLMARRQLRHERPNHTLQPTALVNEVFLRLVDVRQVRWQDRSHFLAMSARLMRRVLVDAARARGYQKRGGGAAQTSLDFRRLAAFQKPPEIVALDTALKALAAKDPRKSQVVELRFFGGLTVEETAEALGVSVATVVRDWKLARAWLLRELRRDERTR
jgi:RNA polymerase sigma-70 factor (ECF subfamily)